MNNAERQRKHRQSGVDTRLTVSAVDADILKEWAVNNGLRIREAFTQLVKLADIEGTNKKAGR